MKHTMKALTVLASFIISSATLFSCYSMSVKDLDDNIRKYSKALKWGAFSTASTMIEEEERKEIIKSRIASLKGKSIVDFAVVDISLNKEDKSANAVVQYSFIDQNTQNLRAVNELQLWKRIKGHWYLSAIMSAKSQAPTHLD